MPVLQAPGEIEESQAALQIQLVNGDLRCITFSGIPADDAIGREVLRVVQPAAVDAAILASEEQAQTRDHVVAAYSAMSKRPGTRRAAPKSNSMPPIKIIAWC